LNLLLVVLPFANACVRHIFKAIMLRNVVSEKMRSVTISDDFVKDNAPLLTILAVSRLVCSTLNLRLTFQIINYLRSTVSSTFLDRMDRYQRNMTDSTHSMTQPCLVQTELFSPAVVHFPCPLRTAILPESLAAPSLLWSDHSISRPTVSLQKSRHGTWKCSQATFLCPLTRTFSHPSVTFISAVWGQFAAHLIFYKISPSLYPFTFRSWYTGR
jgi:hypothetical protein